MILFVPKPSMTFFVSHDCVTAVTLTVMSHYNPNPEVKNRIKNRIKNKREK